LTGRSRLQIPLPPGIPSAPPLVLPGRSLVVALPAQILCLSLQDGKPLWTAPLAERDAAAMLCATGTRLLAAGGSQAAAYDLASGQRAWQVSLTGFQVTGAVLEEDTLYLALRGEKGGAVMAVAADSGQVLWKQALGQEASCPRPLALGRFLVVDAGRDPDDPKAGGNLVLFLDKVTGKRVGSLVIPWNRGRLHAIHRCGAAILLETTSALYCYKPKAP
jgi:outer membrane protein assembly factor BamB